ncbi:Zinc finger FYVE domain-containing protein 16 [Merluccius polli]|uniref:Zinc finger FYVE domain-containing protein 16 n=1 Tax=Merluccius polli TaxID=89951 RepID=A0AA47NA62_MERPO|nr:Zinc finger FYVE domain-containing protein 16 [Merluccius polli]
MDSFFKAAVCDLDKLLDDFELNTEELDGRPVYLKSSAYAVSSPGPQCLPPDGSSTGPPNLPDLNSLHYGSAPDCSDHSASHNNHHHHPHSGIHEAKGQPLTGVDLLSSVDRRPAKGSTPPCPDRTLKPQCDLVSDTSSAILVRAGSHDTFRELDLAERRMEQEEEDDDEEEEEEEEALLVDFASPVITHLWEGAKAARSVGDVDTELQQVSGGDVDSLGQMVDGYSASLSLLDVILPAAAERSCEPVDDSVSNTSEPRDEDDDEEVELEEGDASCVVQQVGNSFRYCKPTGTPPADTPHNNNNNVSEDLPEEPPETDEQQDSSESDSLSTPNTSDNVPAALSCLPMAVSMCGALVNSTKTTKDSLEAVSTGDTASEVSDSTEAESISPSESAMDRFHSNEQMCLDVPHFPRQLAKGGVSLRPPETLPAPSVVVVESCVAEEGGSGDSPEFGFEYLPESDQAELLVTDEELDAFLQAHAEAEQVEGGAFLASRSAECSRGGGCLSDLSNGDDDLEHRLVEEELGGCGENSSAASPESERRAACAALDECLDPAHLSAPRDSLNSYQHETELCSRVRPTTTNTPVQPLHVGSPDLQSSYGGARPKQLHCQAATYSPAAEEEQQDQGAPGSTSNAPTSPAEDATPISPPHPQHPAVADGHDNGDPRLLYTPQGDRCHDPSYNELSEPPPYPEEPSREHSGSADEGSDEGLGCRQPSWVPDAEAPKCMSCDQRFTFTRRRHHCRACGKVYCAICCNRKCKLQYLEKEARVCNRCFESIQIAQALERMMSPTGPSPNPNVPSEYCSTIPPLQQARAAGTLNSPPPTVMVPVSVLKQASNDGCPREQKRVWFADGILPNGEVADTARLAVTGRRSPQESSPVSLDPPTLGPVGSDVRPGGGGGAGGGGGSAPVAPAAPEVVRRPVSGPWDYALLCGVGCPSSRGSSMLPEAEGELPPLIITTGEDETQAVLVEEGPAPCQIMLLLEEGGPQPLTFLLNANLLVNVKLVTYCDQRCWCFGSNGLQALGQRELVFLLECVPEEKTLPRDLFSLYLSIYQDAQNGKFVEDLGNVTFTSSFLGSKEHGGMLFFSPTCQPLEGLSLPPQPFLFGLLIQRLEVPWAKVFPLRLLLRLGTGHSVYPTTPVSIRFRESVYRETGHTIMNLLADLRNYQYSIAIVEGLRIHMEMGHSYIDIPKSRFNEMLKVVNSSNEHVISVGATFSSEADSHLVCFQNEDGNYQTQANSKPGHTRTVTGASFVVFNGALKASSGFIAKSSIVEDGLMVQIPPETMESLRAALRDQTDFLIPCGRSDGGELRENVTVRWVDWNAVLNAGVTSGVDGRSLDGVYSLRTQHDSEFESDGRVIRCTEVFYQLKSAEGCLATVVSSSSVFQREMSLATCSALAPHLAVLTSRGINSLSLRVSTQADMVEYQAGSGGRLLPQCYMNDLDSSLIPVIHGGSAGVPQVPVDMEFLFYITNIM